MIFLFALADISRVSEIARAATFDALFLCIGGLILHKGSQLCDRWAMTSGTVFIIVGCVELITFAISKINVNGIVGGCAFALGLFLAVSDWNKSKKTATQAILGQSGNL